MSIIAQVWIQATLIALCSGAVALATLSVGIAIEEVTQSTAASVGTTTTLTVALLALTAYHTYRGAQVLKTSVAAHPTNVSNPGHYPQLLYAASAAAFATVPLIYYIIR